MSFSAYADGIKKRIMLRYQSFIISICAVSLIPLMLIPTVSGVEIIVNASYDGMAASGADANWSTMRNATGDSARQLWYKVYSGMTESNENQTDVYDEHWRGLVTWDTSIIMDNATITSAVVSVYGKSRMQELGIVNFSIIDADPTDPLAYAEGDYSRTTFTRMASDITFGAYTIDAWNNLTLNPLGRNNISKTGVTTFMFTHSADVDNTNLTWAGKETMPPFEPSASGFYFYGVNFSDGALKPYITINYDLPVVPPVASFTSNVTSGTSPLTVKFTDTSTNSPESWNWSFGDGTWFNTTVAAERNATHTYTTPTTNTVRLTVANAGGSNTTSPGTMITVNAVTILTLDKIGICEDGVWYLDWNGNGVWDQGTDKQDYFGATGWTSVVGDWNPTVPGTEIGVYQNGVWYLDWNGNGTWDQGTDKQYYFGATGWAPVVADWNPAVPGTEIGVYQNGVWYLDWNGNGAWDQGTDKQYYFGATGWTPVVGDWNPAVPSTEIGVFQNGVWYLDWNGSGAWDQGTDKEDYFGAAGWTSVVGDWNPAVSGTEIGVYQNGVWYLDWNGNGAWDQGTDKQYYFGAAGWTPAVGRWS